MSQKEIAFKIEKLKDEAEMIHSLQNALFAVFYCQEEYSVRNFEWTFMLLGDLTGNMLNELRELTGNAFDSIRKGQKNDM